MPQHAAMSYIDSLFRVEGKTALLTGAGGFLVSEMSRALGKAGANVVCCDLRLKNAQKTAADIESAGGRAIAVELDVKERAQHEAALQKALAAFGRLDCVLNGAGIN